MVKNSLAACRTGIFWSFLSAFLWATVYIVSRRLMGGERAQVDPVTLSLLRFSIGGAILFGICLATVRRELFAFSLRELGDVFLLSQLSVVGMSVFLFWGQRYTGAINSAMIMTGSPVLIMLLGLLEGERVTKLQVAGMTVGTIGCLMVIGVIGMGGWTYSFQSFRGDGLVLLAALCWSAGAILARRIVARRHDLAVTAWSMVFASVTLLGINSVRTGGIVMPGNAVTWLLVLYLAVFPTAIGFYAWNAALNRVSLSVVNIMQYLTPIMTMGLAWLLLGESLDGFKFIGAAMVIGGVMLSSRLSGRRR